MSTSTIRVARRMAIGAIATAAFALPAASVAATPTTLQISAYGYFGKVKSASKACVSDRKVVLKQRGHGVLGRDSSDEEGRWKIDPEDLHFKGKLPYKLYAEVKATGKCAGATSKTITINGG
jgi:hypothetical protein